MKKYLDEFEHYYTNVKQSTELTRKAYRTDLTKFIFFVSEYDLNHPDEITETMINSYIIAMEKYGLSPSTVNRNISSLHAFFLFCLKKGIVSCDPSERIKLIKYKKKPPKSTDCNELRKLLDMPDLSTRKGIRDKAMLELLYAAEIRVSELLNLTYEDLSIKLRMITVKNKSSEKFIPFGKEAEDALIQYLHEFEVEKNVQEKLFCSMSKEPMSRQGFWKLVKEYGRKAGISEPITPQMFRNSLVLQKSITR